MTGGPQGFAPLHGSHEGYETGLSPGMAMTDMGSGGVYGHPYSQYSDYGPALHPAQNQQGYPQQQQQQYQYAGPYPTAYGGAAVPGMEADRVPLTRGGEMEDFSRGFHSALDRIGEEDEYGAGAAGASDLLGVNEGNVATATSAQRGGGLGVGTAVSGPSAAVVPKPVGASDAEREPEEGEGTAGSTGSGRPLWQQNRQQSRNLMWM